MSVPDESDNNYERDEAAEQLTRWAEKNKSKIGYSTSASGIDLINKDASMSAGRYGPVVLRDYDFLQQMQSFHRERIPERVVHAKGAGAFGYFECTRDLSDITVSKVFESVGKRTPVAVRFSSVVGRAGSADTVRDPRGFAVKFYSEEGNWDLVGNNTPIFFIRDPILFPMFIHSQKPNPVTNLRDWDTFWDFISLRPETIHQVMFLFSDRGIPDGHRHMNGYGSHTFSFIGKNQKLTWVKFIYETDQGIQNLEPSAAEEIAGKDPDYALRDLYNAIEAAKTTGNYPSWTFYIQTMTPEQVKDQPFNPFDLTKVWPHEQFPLQKVGKIVLNRNPANYFAEVEQAAFNVNNFTPGIGPSPDKMLQGRIFSYNDAHLHRLGTNFQQLPVNHPIAQVKNFERDGPNVIYNQNGAPNYHPNSFGGPEVNPYAKNWVLPPEKVDGYVDWYDLGDDDNYSQPRRFWNKVLDDSAKERLVNNLAEAIQKAREDIRNRTLKVFKEVDANLGDRLTQKLTNLKVFL